MSVFVETHKKIASFCLVEILNLNFVANFEVECF